MSRVALALILLGVAASPAADTVPVNLGGPRDIKGRVTAGEKHVTVTVNFRAVRAFDDTTNAEVNEELGREFAVRTLAAARANGRDVRLALSGEEHVSSGGEKVRYEVTIRWPLAGVKVLATEGKAPDGSRVVRADAFKAKFFTAKQDHLDTLAALVAGNKAAIAAALREANTVPAADRRKALARAVARLEERGLSRLDRLEEEVKKDDNLTDLAERPELMAAITMAREDFLDRLKELAATPVAEVLLEKLPFKDVTLEAPFDVFIRKNVLLMELGGAIVVDRSPKATLLIGIARVALKDGTPEDVHRAERVATIKARVAVLGELEGMKVSYTKVVSEKVVIETTPDGEKAVSTQNRLKVLKEEVEGWVKAYPVVGRWKSEDGRLLYIAVGGQAGK